MVYNRFLCDTNVPISHQVAGGGATPGPSSPIVGIQLANEHGVQERLSDHQTNNYPPDRLLPGAVGDSGTHPLRFGESRDVSRFAGGSVSRSWRPVVDVSRPRGPQHFVPLNWRPLYTLWLGHTARRIPRAVGKNNTTPLPEHPMM